MSEILDEGLRHLGWVPEVRKHIRFWRNEDYLDYLIKQRATNNYAVHRIDRGGPLKYTTSGDDAHNFVVANAKSKTKSLREWIDIVLKEPPERFKNDL